MRGSSVRQLRERIIIHRQHRIISLQLEMQSFFPCGQYKKRVLKKKTVFQTNPDLYELTYPTDRIALTKYSEIVCWCCWSGVVPGTYSDPRMNTSNVSANVPRTE